MCCYLTISLPGLEKLVKHWTGSLVVGRKTLEIDFDTDQDGVIRVSTCLKKMTLPRNVFNDFNTLKAALNTVVESLDFNSV